MSNLVGSLFLITECEKGQIKSVFLEKDVTKAKLYFKGYILDNEEESQYNLYRIADLTKSKRVIENYCFICNGTTAKREYKNEIKKIRQTVLKIEQGLIKSNAELVKEVFDWEFLNDIK